MGSGIAVLRVEVASESSVLMGTTPVEAAGGFATESAPGVAMRLGVAVVFSVLLVLGEESGTVSSVVMGSGIAPVAGGSPTAARPRAVMGVVGVSAPTDAGVLPRVIGRSMDAALGVGV